MRSATAAPPAAGGAAETQALKDQIQDLLFNNGVESVRASELIYHLQVEVVAAMRYALVAQKKVRALEVDRARADGPTRKTWRSRTSTTPPSPGSARPRSSRARSRRA